MATSPTPRSLPDPQEEPTISPARAGAILNLSRRSAYNAIERHEIPAIRVGHRVVVPTKRFLEHFGLVDGSPAA